MKLLKMVSEGLFYHLNFWLFLFFFFSFLCEFYQFFFVPNFPGDNSKCAITDTDEKLRKPNKPMSPNLFTCEGSISLRNPSPSFHKDEDVNWCEKSKSFSNNKSSIDDFTVSSQHRNACISISVGVDA